MTIRHTGVGHSHQANRQPLEPLLARIQKGDRDALAAFIEELRPQIRRRCRGKLAGSIHRLFDTDDLFSTVSRRLDQFASRGEITAETVRQMQALIMRTAENVLAEKARLLQPRPEMDRFATSRQSGPTGPDTTIEGREMLEKLVRQAGDRTDHEILILWLRGNRWSNIAPGLGMPPARVRKRWQQIRARLARTMRMLH